MYGINYIILDTRGHGTRGISSKGWRANRTRPFYMGHRAIRTQLLEQDE